MSTTATTPADRPLTRAELDALAQEIAVGLAAVLKPKFKALEVRMAAIESEQVSLRRQFTTGAPGPGVRRRFTGQVTEDPDHPGCSLVYLDDGSAMTLPDARLNALADVRTAGRA